MTTKSLIEKELEGKNLINMYECPKCGCYNRTRVCLVCNNQSCVVKTLYKEEDFISAICKAKEELMKKICTPITETKVLDMTRTHEVKRRKNLIEIWLDIKEVLGDEK